MSRKPIPGAPSPEPWKPVEYELADVSAIQALMRGDANEDQQRRAFGFIVERIAGTYDMSFRPEQFGGSRATDFAEGKRHVGNTLVKLSKLNLAKMRSTDDRPAEQQ